ncbi:MAG: glycosyltransferase, partial [Chloroflexi bacterium]|nr:glycosyltransferase [Chloroflexota bacterium]
FAVLVLVLSMAVPVSAGEIHSAVTSNNLARVKALLKDRQFDLIHVFGYSPSTVAAIRWARRLDVPLLLELVNAVSSPYQYLPGTRRFSAYDLNSQSVIVAISRELGQVSERAGLTGNIWVRPNPIDTGRFKPFSADARVAARKELFGFGPESRTVVYVAKFLERKNHSFLIDVLARLPKNYNMVLAGPPLPDIHSVPGLTLAQIPSLARKAAELGVSDRLVVRPGFVDFAEYLKAADLTCFPSVREGMGTPLLESLAAGVPVVANNGESSFREHIVNGENGYLEPLDPDAWGQAVVKAAELSAEKREKFAVDISERYSTDRIDASYYKLMTALAGSRKNEHVSVAQVLGL